jgi:two-component system, sensor histidine kinase and response regulator
VNPSDGRPPRPHPAPAPSETTILVVDDKENNRALIQALFDGPEYRVLEAADGIAALALARTERLDCILLDLNMPGLTGFDVLERLEADPRTREVPVIILTASDERLETMEQALRGGAVDYITKPISPLRVAIRVRGAIERRRLLQEVQDLRASFTSMLVHDLRSPLTVITAYLDMLQQPTVGPLTDAQQRYLGKMGQAVTQMLRLIGEILDLSKIEAGKFSVTPELTDLAAAVADAAERFTPGAASKRVSLEVRRPGTPVRVSADPNRLDQVLMNLLSNALKFTPAGGTIRVAVAERLEEVEVSVHDSGPGIPPEEQTLLFEKFSQTSSGKSVLGGSGLGLVICRHLVEAHGGRIWVESEPGRGTRFAFRLPRMGPTAEPQAAGRQAGSPNADHGGDHRAIQ